MSVVAASRATPSSSSSTTALRWRVIPDAAGEAARNMALDHALAGAVAPGEAVLRLYGWTRPTVSFGRNEPTAGRYSRSRASERGIDFVRRPTGGRAVLHHHELTYAVVARADALGGPRAAYRSINEALAAALRALGVAVEVSRNGRSLPPDHGPCFRAPAVGEVVASGRKLVGSAQARIDGALLQHGSIIIAGNPSALAGLMTPAEGGKPGLPGGDSLDETTAALEDLLPSEHAWTALERRSSSARAGSGREGLRSRLARELSAAFATFFPGTWDTGGYTPVELAEAERLEDERYARDSWTWRR